MSYSVRWEPDALKLLDSLPKEISIRIIKKVESIKYLPFHYMQHYEGEKVYKLRVGDYRALVDVDFSNKVLIIRVLDHRKRIYKRGF